MKRIIIFFCISTIIYGCKNKDQFVIDGKLENIGQIQKVYLYATNSENQLVPQDSTFLNEDQTFRFTGVSTEPNFYQIIINKKSYLVIAQNGDEINFKANLSDPNASYELTGSDEAAKLTTFNKITAAFSNSSGQLAEKYSKLIANNPNTKDDIIAEFNEKSQQLISPFLAKAYQFINENPKTLTAFYAANLIQSMDLGAEYENRLIDYSKTLESAFPNNKMVDAFAKEIAKQATVAIGQMAPEIIATNPQGKQIKLSDYKGKYVLLDFWASWCAPCREENPNLVKQYQKFKNRNFTIVGFSLDDNEAQWKNAIEKDNLNWNHFTELKQWDAAAAMQYNITAIPASFILDPQGKIIAKNLKGIALEKFLDNNLK